MLLLLLCTVGSSVEQASAQENTAGQQAPDTPEVAAEAWSLVDAQTGIYLAGENPDEQLPIASINKVMAAYVVLEEGVDLDRELVVTETGEQFVGFTYSNVGLIRGERVSVRDLLVASLIPSGTDAIYTVAEFVGDGSVDRFVEMMNEKASSMGLENTRFTSPAGLDAPDNYSSARDLATLARASMEYPFFRETVGRTDATISTQNRDIQIVTTNELLRFYPKATGIKTGTSPEAGPSLVASAREGEESYIAVVLAAQDDIQRIRATETLLEWGFSNYERQALVEEGERYEELPLPYRPDESVQLVAERNVTGLAGPGIEAEQNVETRELPDSANRGQELGEIEVLVGDQNVGSSPLVAREGYEEASFWQRLWSGIRGIFENITGG